MNQTGNVETQVSSTNVPQEDPQQMETHALEAVACLCTARLLVTKKLVLMTVVKS